MLKTRLRSIKCNIYINCCWLQSFEYLTKTPCTILDRKNRFRLCNLAELRIEKFMNFESSPRVWNNISIYIKSHGQQNKKVHVYSRFSKVLKKNDYFTWRSPLLDIGSNIQKMLWVHMLPVRPCKGSDTKKLNKCQRINNRESDLIFTKMKGKTICKEEKLN